MTRVSRLAAASIMLLVTSMPTGLRAQPPQSPGEDLTIDGQVRTRVLDGVIAALTEFYVFPDVAARMTDAIAQRRQRHEYDAITSARELAQTLTTHLTEVSHDRHLRVNYSASVLPPFPYPPPPPSPEQIDRQRAALKQINFGFEKVERLAGNIGYLDLRGFMPPTLMGETAAAAMTFLGGAQALIIDLRQNGGGSPDGVALMASYLFEQPVRMNDIYDRPSNETRQFWTLPYVAGQRFVGRDVYVLTSTRTFSAAEDFTYGVKNHKRATIVGEVTGGGAHPVGPRRIDDHFVVAVPMGRSISSMTHTDWEGVGVEPDVKVSAPQALATAHLMALEKRLPAVTEPPMKTEIAAAIERLKKELAQPKP
ncbi:MAG TPA: S41 family peptidase [Vicinamibacterales bacterium]|nr:S41 family peptidase [Vicinamibacterales bacterium]